MLIPKLDEIHGGFSMMNSTKGPFSFACVVSLEEFIPRRYRSEVAPKDSSLDEKEYIREVKRKKKPRKQFDRVPNEFVFQERREKYSQRLKGGETNVVQPSER